MAEVIKDSLTIVLLAIGPTKKGLKIIHSHSKIHEYFDTIYMAFLGILRLRAD